MLDTQTAKNESLIVKNFDKNLAQPEWSAARTAKHVPKPHLKICGPGSIIMETLYTNANITGSSIEQYLHIAGNMICSSVAQCDTGRTGSNMNLIKTKKRTQLGGEVYSDLVFLSFNPRWLHETGVKILVKAWKESGHKLQITKNDALHRSQAPPQLRLARPRIVPEGSAPVQADWLPRLKKKRANPTESRPYAPPLRRVARPYRPPGVRPGP